jgi:hypothetical protein
MYLLTESCTLRSEGRRDGIGNDPFLMETAALPVEVYMFLQSHAVIFDFVIRPRTDLPVLVELVHLLRNSHTSILATQSEERDCETAFNVFSIEKSRHTPYRRAVCWIQEEEPEDLRGPDVNGPQSRLEFSQQIHRETLK